MKKLESIKELHAFINGCRKRGDRIAFVPTMGNLHQGHLKLVENAHQHANKVIVSVFVNPLQFPPGTDFEDYPRSLDDDLKQLHSYNVDIVFTPDVDEIVADDKMAKTVVEVKDISNILCGQYRPGHFQGVTTIVSKLFNIVQPDIAVFGEKDFQQLTIIRKMVADLCYPIEVIGVPTVRESNGLAMSSRNQYLTTDEQAIAAEMYQTLLEVKEKVEANQSSFNDIESNAMDRLQNTGFRPEYVSIREPYSFDPGQANSKHLRIIAAAWLGQARLIDNIEIR